MIIQDMQFIPHNLPNLNLSNGQIKELNMAIVKQRAKSVASSKKKLKKVNPEQVIQGEFDCKGYISLKSERFFIYALRIAFIPVSEVIDDERITIYDRKILAEQIIEASLDEWLDEINK